MSKQKTNHTWEERLVERVGISGAQPPHRKTNKEQTEKCSKREHENREVTGKTNK